MKLAYLANIRFPSERAHAAQIVEVCNAFVQNGVDVSLFVNSRPTPVTVSPAEYYGKPLLFKVTHISVPNIGYRGKLLYQVANVIYFFNLLRQINRKEFDVFYVRNEWLVYFLSFFVSAHKIIWESHDGKLNFPARRILKNRIKTIVTAKSIMEFYTSKDYDEASICLATNGIDEDFFDKVEVKQDARKRLGLPQDAQIVMYIGGFDRWKGITTFFDCANLIPNVLFVAIGGKGEEIEKYRSIYPQVTFLGNLPYSQLKNNQAAADILVVPNTAQNKQSAQFTSPLKLFAHMTSGVPIIISDLPSLTNISGRENVTVVPADDSDALKNGIFDIFNSYELKKKKAQELVRYAKKYTWDERAKKILAFIKE